MFRTLPITVITRCFEALDHRWVNSSFWQSLTEATFPWMIIYLLGKLGLEAAIVCLSW